MHNKYDFVKYHNVTSFPGMEIFVERHTRELGEITVFYSWQL